MKRPRIVPLSGGIALLALVVALWWLSGSRARERERRLATFCTYVILSLERIEGEYRDIAVQPLSKMSRDYNSYQFMFAAGDANQYGAIQLCSDKNEAPFPYARLERCIFADDYPCMTDLARAAVEAMGVSAEHDFGALQITK